MKNAFSTLLITLIASATTMAASKKVCFGTGEAKGQGFVVELNTKRAKITRSFGNVDRDAFVGTYKKDGEVNSRNGLMISYDMGTLDGANNLLVPEELLENETQGYVKIRNRGEGFYQDSYFCRDEKATDRTR